LKILVCDDERHVTKLVEANLARQGHTVVRVHDGQEAIELLEAMDVLEEVPSFDRIVLDVMMPGMGGQEVLKWIRRQESIRQVWVGLMIARAEDREVFDQGPYRADAYFVKPFNPSDLLR